MKNTMKENSNYDIVDVIIENITKEWEESMKNNSINKEKWEVPKYSKSEINKAGKIISNPESSKEDRDNALVILNNWRASHAYPLQVICTNLRRKNPNAIVVQRLKRLESITGKIERFPEMQLYKMQDLGGCRVIVETIDQVYEAVRKYKKSYIKHIFKKENDYIKNPKESGYRSYHMVYKFYSDKKETYNNNMLIEIQFRTKLQHIWATAVEMMGIYTKSNLKASQGDKEILRFFTIVSSIFAIQENMPTCPNTPRFMGDLIPEMKELNEKHKILDILSALKVSIDYTTKLNFKNKNLYYLLILDYIKGKVQIRSFPTSKVEFATKVYDNIEKSSTKDVVLVSATSFDTLKFAYPNYFVDISDFIDTLQFIITGYENALKEDKLIEQQILKRNS